MIYDSILDCIGNTPMIRASRFEKKRSLHAELYLKLESCNPGGSAKDRVALEMIRAAEADGRLTSGATIIEATSGNTGVGLALAASILGYHVILTMPETMSIERRKLLSAFGAELILTDGKKGMAGANDKAAELVAAIPGSMRAFQFENPDNPAAHYKSTGPEIWRDMDGRVDAFVATVGTGGTLCGTARYLKERAPNVCVFAVEPAESPLLSGGKAGPHGIQGIGANFVPGNYDPSVVDGVLTVSTADAIEAAKLLISAEGILCGISSGACACGGEQVARMPAFAGKRIALLLPDTGERYLSTELFD